MKTISSQNTNGVELLAKAAQQLSMARDLNVVMSIVRRAARQLVRADGSTFILREGDMCFYADEDAIGPLWKGSRFPISSCISGHVMRNKKEVVIENIHEDDRISQDVYGNTFVKSLAMVPIRTMDPIGAIGVYWEHHYRPAKTQLIFLQSLADITAVTLENIKIYSELEQRIKTRTAELENLNKQLESFSYSVSHDLRAPLRAINGYLTILMEDHVAEMSSGAKQIATRVMQNAEHMTQLIDDLLAFFKTGVQDLQKAPVNMTQLVKGICRQLKEELKDRKIEFIIRELPDANGDSAMIRQVWTNLLANAIKYTGKQDTAVIEIGVETSNGSIAYFVKDNGAGFDMHYYDRLFGVFQRLHSQREFEGTGIGLAIVHKIVSRHNGTVWAQGVENEGATFYFTLNV